jgi:hypothetical protein
VRKWPTLDCVVSGSLSGPPFLLVLLDLIYFLFDGFNFLVILKLESTDDF